MFIPILPVAKGRPRFVTRGGKNWTITPDKTRVAEKNMRQYILDNFEKFNPYNIDLPFKGAVELTSKFLIPKANKSKYLIPICRPDVDNYGKLLCDAFLGIFFIDDSQIVKFSCSKEYVDKQEDIGIEFNITEIACQEACLRKSKKSLINKKKKENE